MDEPATTSAGVFAPDGTLIRTLWSKVHYGAGTNSAVWDGLDDCSNAVPPGTYQIRLLQHNLVYVWDGAIGNTSAELSGPSVHAAFGPMADMAIAVTNAYYVTGYNEGKYDFCNFLTTDPQHVRMKWSADGQPANIYDRNWCWTATDGQWVYFACDSATDPTNLAQTDWPGFIVASQIGDNATASFSQGIPIINGAYNSTYYPSGIYVGTQPGLSGLAVQQSGHLLAAAVSPDNRVYLMDKRSGAGVGSFSVNAPGRLSFSSDGSLWAISGNNVIDYTNLPNPALAQVITNLSEPLALAVCPTNPDLILVADGGPSQQVKAFDHTGNMLWCYGQSGGYQTNGPAVTTDKFWFDDAGTDGSFLCFEGDGSFWVGDGGNHRSLHFSAGCEYIDQIMFQPHSWNAAADQNNPSRVFNQFLEYNVDYSKPLSQGWKLVNNWKANVDPCHISWNEGIREVTTFTNGRSYALVDNNCQGPQAVQEVCELATNGLRLTGIFPFENGGWVSLGPDGSVRATTIGAAQWYESSLSGFDASNNPVWNPATLMASAPDGSTDPVPRGGSFGNIRATVSTNNILISFDQSQNDGWHLGGIRLGCTNWLWKASPAVKYMDGHGTYEIGNGLQYGGNTVQAIGRNVIYGYQGEFFRGSGEAAQNMHFYDDGLFVGQFGEALNGHSVDEGALPGFAGNGQCPSLIQTTNGEFYLWVNDESDHGPQRWHFVNARNIREQTGCGNLGAAILLTNQAAGFPAALTVKNGNQSGELCWLPVPGATSYNIRVSFSNGGPYNLVGNTTNLNFLAGGLTNGQTSYFVVTAVQGGCEGMPSEQVSVHPFDTSRSVLCAGSTFDGGQFTPVIDVSSTALASNQPSYIGAEHLTGILNLQELDNYGYGNLQNEIVGAKGFALFEYQGPATSLVNLLAPFTYSYDGGWVDIADLERQEWLDNSLLGMNNGMVANPVGTLDIDVSDTNYHYLTVVSPAQFTSPRDFTLGVISQDGTSVRYDVNENYGLSHVFQFLFKGNITLLADGTRGNGAIVQALFVDDAPVTAAALQGSTNSLTDITNGLEVYYPLETNGDDAMGRNNLTLIGSPEFSSEAVDWNDSANSTLGYSSPQQWPQCGLTVSAWIKMADPQATYSVAACYGDYTGSVDEAYLQFYTLAGQIGARIVQTRDVDYIGRYTPACLSNGWHFVAVTWSGENSASAIRIYLDGTRVDTTDNNSGNFSGPYSGSDVPLALGAQLSPGTGISAEFYGSQKFVRLYHRPLSAGEIALLYTNELDSIISQPGFGGVNLSGNNIILQCGNGSAGRTYYVLASTNLLQPSRNWIPVATNIPTADGNFTICITNAASPETPQQYFMIEAP